MRRPALTGGVRRADKFPQRAKSSSLTGGSSWTEVFRAAVFCKARRCHHRGRSRADTAEDAERGLKAGVSVIWVSTHGGRQVDHARGVYEILPEIVRVAKGRRRSINRASSARSR